MASSNQVTANQSFVKLSRCSICKAPKMQGETCVNAECVKAMENRTFERRRTKMIIGVKGTHGFHEFSSGLTQDELRAEKRRAALLAEREARKAARKASRA